MVHAPNGTRAKWHTRQMVHARTGAKWHTSPFWYFGKVIITFFAHCGLPWRMTWKKWPQDCSGVLPASMCIVYRKVYILLCCSCSCKAFIQTWYYLVHLMWDDQTSSDPIRHDPIPNTIRHDSDRLGRQTWPADLAGRLGRQTIL
jgi:hypothetical protein